MTGARPSFLGLLKTYPWLIVVLALSAMVTVWAVTRRAPVPVPIPPAAAPVAEAPAPAPEPEEVPFPFPTPAPVPAPAPAPKTVSAPEVPASNPTSGQFGPIVPTSEQFKPMVQGPDGAFKGGPPLPSR